MAFSPLRLKPVRHSRSLSLPSESHPSTSKFDALNASEANDRMTGIKNLYHSFDDLLLSPHIQRAVSQESQAKWVDQALEGHIRLLDACSTAKDLFSEMKHDVEKLLSALRRKDTQSIQCYMTYRKKSRKMIQKSLKDLRSKRIIVSLEIDNELVCIWKEAESSTLVMLESLLSYAMGSNTQTRQSGWSFVSKLVKSHQGEETELNELTIVDALLHESREDDSQVELVNHLQEMDSNIQVLEDELECLFRQLIKTRVSLLNIIDS